MGDHCKRIVGKTVGHRHGFSGTHEGCRTDNRGWNALFFHDDAIEHTARAARPSIANTGHHQIDLSSQIFSHILGNSMGRGRLSHKEISTETMKRL